MSSGGGFDVLFMFYNSRRTGSSLNKEDGCIGVKAAEFHLSLFRRRTPVESEESERVSFIFVLLNVFVFCFFSCYVESYVTNKTRDSSVTHQ